MFWLFTMARSIPPERLCRLVEVAAEVFISQGYRRTQMDDVAYVLGVAKGTVYACVESKAALFDAVVSYADNLELLPGTDTLPLRSPPAGATLEKLRRRLIEGAKDLELGRALKRGRPRDLKAEFSAILRDLYQRLQRYRRTIKIVDRCAIDQPELAELWFAEGRKKQQDAIAHYLERRQSDGVLRPLPDVQIAARVILETIVFWAVHRHWDPAPQQLAEDKVPDILVDFLFDGLGKEGR